MQESRESTASNHSLVHENYVFKGLIEAFCMLALCTFEIFIAYTKSKHMQELIPFKDVYKPVSPAIVIFLGTLICFRVVL